MRLRGRPVVLLGEGPVADEQRRLLERAGARIVSEGSKAVLAIVVDDPAAVSRMKMRGVLVYAVDQPDLCDIILTRAVEQGSPRKAPRHASVAGADRVVDVGARPETPDAPAALAATHSEIAPSGVRISAEEPARAVAKKVRPDKKIRPAKAPRVAKEKAEDAGPGLLRKAASKIAHFLGGLADLAAAAGKLCLRLLLLLFGPFWAIPMIIASAIRTRMSRSREPSLALGMVLAKGGPLDPLVGGERGADDVSESATPNAATVTGASAQ
ncbi:NAD(P)-dependent oxidoreductase [Sphingomonas abietis]|uniref:NAD(P)-dependent oxidoreductase n=2 Tax=Sphingomonas abietis TaxID=3012344 RepID=A0ABY7NUP7_9SPHN|nr:NAD(P)-dependent oxidoreductase [Sphingomonas abietis]